MKKSKIKIFMCLAFGLCFMSFTGKMSYAADDEEYITITIDAEDNSGSLLYSIDSTDADAFTNSNTFTIPAEETHTIYVKDEAGNITSQEYIPDTKKVTDVSEISSDDANNTGNKEDISDDSNVPEQSSEDASGNDTYADIYTYDNADNTGKEMQDINIELEVGEDGKVENINYSGILGTGNGHASLPARTESGTGTASDKVITDGTDNGEKVFYTVTTAEGDTFYMVIDQRENNDNVYLLNTVTRADLAALAADGSNEGNINDTIKNEKEDSLLDAIQNEKSVSSDSGSDEKTLKDDNGGGLNPQIIVIAAVVIGGGVYYYLKVYKNKKDEQMDVMDAMDMGDFVPESEDDEDDEAEFEFADDEKQEFLNNLINDKEEETLYNTTPEEYAASEKYAASEEDSARTETEDVPIASQVAAFDVDYDPELDGEEDDSDWEEE